MQDSANIVSSDYGHCRNLPCKLYLFHSQVSNLHLNLLLTTENLQFGPSEADFRMHVGVQTELQIQHTSFIQNSCFDPSRCHSGGTSARILCCSKHGLHSGGRLSRQVGFCSSQLAGRITGFSLVVLQSISSSRTSERSQDKVG